MLFEASGQFFVFLFTFCFSFFLAIICEIFRLFYVRAKHKFVVSSFDFMLTIVVSCLFFLVCVVLNYGHIRLFILISYLFGLICGSALFAKIKKLLLKKKIEKLLKKKKM